MAPLFALLDCNNFYVSCERLFNPRLAGLPVVVLSNNDGCIIARSNEAKALGIKMGEPFFKCRSLIATHRVQVFSSNYPLYGDLSQRVMEVLGQLEADVEVYSIDEAFIRLPPATPAALLANGRKLRAAIKRQVGIPVSIGFGPTKTLAKIANRIAKKQLEHDGVFVLPEQGLDALLATIAVGEVWGIGPRQSQKLLRCGIRTALDLKNGNDTWLRKQLTITGLRTATELRGVSCLPLEDSPVAKQSITSSRSFGQPVTELNGLAEALASYVAIAAAKLRGERMTAGCLQVYLATNRFRAQEQQYANNKTATLAIPTASTLELIRYAVEALRQLYRPGFAYQKVGVTLMDLASASRVQPHLFCPQPKGHEALMTALDKVNDRWGRDTLHSAAAGFLRPWKNKQTRRSPAYTTSWHELPVVG
jgi:DNA polymerase V